MVQFNDWCDAADSTVGAHGFRILSGDPLRLNAGVAARPRSYELTTPPQSASRDSPAARKPEATKFVEGKLPTSKAIRSGDLAESLATEWIATQGGRQAVRKSGFLPLDSHQQSSMVLSFYIKLFKAYSGVSSDKLGWAKIIPFHCFLS